MSIQMLQVVTSWVSLGFFWAMALAAFVGAIMVATTRDDAFTAADRQSKWVWLALLIGSTLVLLVGFIPILPWIAMVITGLYWFDVRPQIKDILAGNW